MKKKPKQLAKKKAANLPPGAAALVSVLRSVSKRASSGQESSELMLWDAFHCLARFLADRARARPAGVNFYLLNNVMLCCLHILDQAMKRGEVEAVWNLYYLTIQGSDLLRMVADKDPQFVANLRENAPGWALLMDCASNHVEPRPMQLARMIFDQIRSARLYTRREKAWNKLPESRLKAGEQICRIDSRDCPKAVFDLPHLNEKTYKTWWQEAGDLMLERYWERNPGIAETDWKESDYLKGNLKLDEGGRHSVKNYVKSKVRKAFYRIALTYIRTPAIKCDQCGVEKHSKTLRELRAATRREGWITKNRNDYCPACITAGLVAV
jgi:hypothetical protein